MSFSKFFDSPLVKTKITSANVKPPEMLLSPSFPIWKIPCIPADTCSEPTTTFPRKASHYARNRLSKT